ncbi:P2 phage tail completion protein R (GpR) [Serratia quinivorans]|uniref:phage tail protein n=1 Tax=Serratia TaxID=613 RepID=UPI0021778B7D|nr:phage tail protein [Serratia quinivorans]CAI1055508.1 P2 phage tail completion protein R (GpR) [Serratia quinivorans]CAI1070697.1 P2 phage tail completion protein R (GpR) [Serratia quinivorans]CAI1873544.1 P2 phage tail completion protein R (GpR) [Serratia quinivorans]CAI2122565.1 P2 phage tail completion protein R (GpR) [Serratia quinivorans]CAI2489074.1 P2 phage tail completion protein R (GpR) [Serratia quinivorans]
MLKPQQLRAELTNCLQWLQRNPENLQVRVPGGNIASTLATSLSHEYSYTLNLLFLDYTGDLDLIVVPIQAWLRENQPDIMATPEKRRTGFTFATDFNNDGSYDFSVSLQLTERVVVSEQDGGALHVKHLPEPPLPENVTRPLQLFVHGELVSEWHERV